MKDVIEQLIAIAIIKDNFLRKKSSIFILIPLMVFTITIPVANIIKKQRQISQVKEFIQYKKPGIPSIELDILADVIVDQASRLDIPDYILVDNLQVDKVRLLTAVIHTESSFSKKALSKSGALGYMQLMRPTAQWLAKTHRVPLKQENIWQAEVNIYIGVTYVNMLLKEFDNLRLSLLAYNAGPGAIKRGGGIPSYWTKIHGVYNEMAQYKMHDQLSSLLAMQR